MKTLFKNIPFFVMCIMLLTTISIDIFQLQHVSLLVSKIPALVVTALYLKKNNSKEGD